MSFFPIEEPGSLLLLKVLHADELGRGQSPLEMGRAVMALPLNQLPEERWLQLVGEKAGDRVSGAVKVRLLYTATTQLFVQQGRRARIGGISVADNDVLNSTVRVTVSCEHGSVAVPPNSRIALLANDILAREDPRDTLSVYSGRFGGRGTPAPRLGWVIGDGRGGRVMQFDARLPDAQAALSELEYTSPVNVSADRIEVVVDDRGHTGAGGNKSDALEINVALHAGAANTAPRLTMWPENRGARVLPQSLGAAAAREAPLGVEFALHGLYLEDEDNLDGLMQVAARTCPCAPMQGRLLQLQQPRCAVASRSELLHCCGVPETAAAERFHVALSQVTVTATHGLLSLHGLGPWSAGGAGRAVFEETVQRRADGSVFEVWGRQVATTRVRGYTQRSVLCATVGGFSDEYLVEGPVAGQLRVRRNSGPAEYPAGASAPLREVLLHAGHALPLHYDAEADFALQLFVSASADVNVLLLDEDNYELYSQARPFAFVPGPSFLGARNASVARFEVAVPRPTRWFLVVVVARMKPLPPPPAPRTDRTRLVPPPVLIGHASSHPPY